MDFLCAAIVHQFVRRRSPVLQPASSGDSVDHRIDQFRRDHNIAAIVQCGDGLVFPLSIPVPVHLIDRDHLHPIAIVIARFGRSDNDDPIGPLL